MSLRWYVIRTYSGHEKRVKTNIEKLVKLRNLEGCVGEVNIPTIKVAEMKNGKKRVVEKKFMPGYIIAQLDLIKKDLIFLIQDVSSVVGLVGSPAPKALDEKEAQSLMQSEQTDVSEDPGLARVLFQIGERVKIIDGPFANFTGVVDEVMPEKSKLRVKVEIFGQSTPVELEYLQVASNVG